MTTNNTEEVWLRGPVEGIIPLLQPVVHALLQAREEINAALQGFDDSLLWEKPAGTASVGFHLQHLRGVLSRLFTYATGDVLTKQQLLELAQEGKQQEGETCTTQTLLQLFNKQVDAAITQLHTTGESDLLQPRGVGRKQLPSNVLGLLVHAAEHTQRHTGQLLVTAKVVSYAKKSENV
ncbi:DinB family protein [Deminuibacter soli]|uniref:DinB family protein n=1 Tax=Deminuibacter soli TaxID=2291815 RepID=A0A3E1NQR4_9BACT|nr:DinB family protein [Deminuibacter soli]RFM30299.1 DinB family protein [Deminuibacter soli]